MFLLIVIAIVAGALPSAGCHGLVAPTDDLIVRRFAPTSRWTGHFGVDVASTIGTAVPAVGAGVVTFSGVVVGNNTVTLDHGGGVRTSYSYLEVRLVQRGDRVRPGAQVARSGLHDHRQTYHLSLRLDGRYVDPLVLNRCSTAVANALYLADADDSYAPFRDWNTRRNIRSAARWASVLGERRRRAAGDRRGAFHSGRRAVAKGKRGRDERAPPDRYDAPGGH